MEQKNSKNTIGLVLGVVSIVFGSIGAIMFGWIPAILALAAGIVGLIMAIGVKKETNEAQGGGAFVCALIGVIISAIFTIGCSAYCACTAGVGCGGCVGTACAAESAASDLEDALEDLNDLYY